MCPHIGLSDFDAPLPGSGRLESSLPPPSLPGSGRALVGPPGQGPAAAAPSSTAFGKGGFFEYIMT